MMLNSLIIDTNMIYDRSRVSLVENIMIVSLDWVAKVNNDVPTI
jgi:hypothetical protein